MHRENFVLLLHVIVFCFSPVYFVVFQFRFLTLQINTGKFRWNLFSVALSF